ncbi:hypothetical protein JMN32_05065 [Fulvivirga sp. 29W222]|uniref:Uncharacterized protein n=1 Tax=Fulvivirga marina TaxID=2494733 RepID=A0A937KB69_9BACT|nr:hypothetical protein [Fulvivirga marina]MBL6445667.1 hypothetical protein [Fulvivirga marina]
MSKRHLLLLTGLVICCIGSVLFLSKPALHPFFDLSNSGPIGDTIGGITAPIINLVGAILVYISFKAQIAANKVQERAIDGERNRNRQQQNFSSSLKLLELCRKEFDDLTYKSGKNQIETGQDSLRQYINKLKTPNSDEVIHKTAYHLSLYASVNKLSMLMKRVSKLEMFKDDKIYLALLIQDFYYYSYGHYYGYLADAVEKRLAMLEKKLKNSVVDVKDLDYLTAESQLTLFRNIFLDLVTNFHELDSQIQEWQNERKN